MDISSYKASDISREYEWDHVLMGCYGFVCGMAIHPKDPHVMYVWTDVGGMYRFDPENESWIQLMDVLGYDQTHLKAVSGVALDPDDTDVVYVSCGDIPTMSDILKSTDRGRTWSTTDFASRAGLTENIICYNKTIARAVGDPLVFDPNNSQILYFGTMQNGLYRSTDHGESWTKVESVPDRGPTEGGIANIYINPHKVRDGVSTDIYVSSWGNGIYKSTDGGLSFSLMEGSPLVPAQVEIVMRNGKERLYVTSFRTERFKNFEQLPRQELGSFLMYEDGVWTDLNPTRGVPNYTEVHKLTSYSSFLIDSRNPDIIIVNISPWNETPYAVWRSLDGGLSFNMVSDTHQAARMLQDPLNPDNLWMPFGGNVAYWENFGTYTAENLFTKTQFINRGVGIETICVTKMAALSGTQSAPILLLMSQDHSLRVQEDLRVQAPDRTSTPVFTHGGGIDFCEGDPSFVVRAGTYGPHDGGKGTLAYSVDSGRSFTATNWDESMRLVDCAVGAEKQENGFPILMAYSVGRDSTKPDGTGVYRSLDGGATWEFMPTLPVFDKRYIASHTYNNRLLASDRVDPKVFYHVGVGQTLYRTKDGGDSWEELTVAVPGVTEKIAGRESVKCVPNKAGHVWVKGENGVIFTSADYGETWSTLPVIKALMSHSGSFGFGIGKDPAGDPAVYVVGYVDGKLGCYLSEDMGKTWTKISPDEQQFFAGVVDVVGDRRLFGRVFMATGGNGALYAQRKS